jgi:hypothetical protein
MARRTNWSRLNSRDRMRQQGVEDKKGEASFVDPLLKKNDRVKTVPARPNFAIKQRRHS